MNKKDNNHDYEIINLLEKDIFCYIYKVLNKSDNKCYILKKIAIPFLEIPKINKDKLSNIKNNHIVNYIGSFPDSKFKNYYNIVMDFCDDLSLGNFLNEQKKNNKYLKIEIIYHIFMNICLGIQELHKNNLIHGHLNPNNLFLTKDLIVKIGDLGLTQKLINFNASENKNQSTPYYLIPEITEGKQLDNKVDIWLLGCILYELSTLNKYPNNLDKSINIEYYGIELQNLINDLLNEKPNLRPDINQVLLIVDKYISKFNINIVKKQNIFYIFLENEVYEKYIIENSIKHPLEDYLNYISLWNKLINSELLNNKENSKDFCSLLDFLQFSFKSNSINDNKDDEKFINDNIYIAETINMKFLEIIMNKLNEKIKKERIIVYNQNKFKEKIQKIKNILISQKYLNNLKGKENNILIINRENIDNNRLINEFLNLQNLGLEDNNNESIDLKEYTGLRNNNKYKLFKIKGMLNNANNGIIDKLFNLDNPNSSMNCIWYCFQGQNIKEIDKKYIKALIILYNTYKIPIIFIYINKFNENKNDECQKEFKKYLNEIYFNDQNKVNEYLKNYINIDGNNYNSLDLNNLEKITLEEMKAKGFDPINREINQILINAIFDLNFPEFINKKLGEICISKNIRDYMNILFKIINNDIFDLNDENKNHNKKYLDDIYSSFNRLKYGLKEELKHKLELEKLRLDNQEMMTKYFFKKSEEYRIKINLNNYTKKVNELIYKKFNSYSDRIIQNLLNISFHLLVIQRIKETIKENFESYKTEIIKDIYDKFIKEQISQNDIIQNNNENINNIPNKNNINDNSSNKQNFIGPIRKRESLPNIRLKNLNININNYLSNKKKIYNNNKNNIITNNSKNKNNSSLKINKSVIGQNKNKLINEIPTNENIGSIGKIKTSMKNSSITPIIQNSKKIIHQKKNIIIPNILNNEKQIFQTIPVQINQNNINLKNRNPNYRSHQKLNNSKINNTSSKLGEREKNSINIYKSNKILECKKQLNFINETNNISKFTKIENIKKNQIYDFKNSNYDEQNPNLEFRINNKSNIINVTNIDNESQEQLELNLNKTEHNKIIFNNYKEIKNSKNENFDLFNYTSRNPTYNQYRNQPKKNKIKNIEIVYNKPIKMPIKIKPTIYEEVKINEPIEYCYATYSQNN